MYSISNTVIGYQNRKSKQNRSIVWFFFLVSPFLTFFFSIFNLRQKWARVAMILFIGFLGFTFHIAEGSDANRYRDAFIYNASIETSDSNAFSRILIYGTGSVDLLESLISFIVSRFTADFRILFAVYGLIFGYFFVKSIGLLLRYSNTSGLPWHILVYLICFCFVWGIWDFNVFRFTTASWMFVSGVLPFIYKRSNENIGWALITPLMHFSFFLPLVVLAVYLLFRERLVFCFFIFLMGLFFSEVDFGQVRDLATNLPEVFQDKTSTYANENFAEYRQELNESKNWYAEIYQAVLKWISVVIMVVAFVSMRLFKNLPPQFKDLLSFCLFFYGVFSMLSNIPAFSRFLFMGSILISGFAFLYFQFADEFKILPVKTISFILLIPIVFFVSVKLRIGSDFISLNTLISNPVMASFGEDNPSILSILKK